MQQGAFNEKVSLVQAITAIATSLITPAIIWLVGTTNTSSERLARIEERISFTASDRYTEKDAQKDLQFIRSRIEELDKRLNRLELK